MGRLRKPLEGRSEAHVGFRPRSMRSLAATSRNPFLLDFRSSWTTIVDMRVDQLRGKRPHGRQYAANWAFSNGVITGIVLEGSHLDSHIAIFCPRRRVLYVKPPLTWVSHRRPSRKAGSPYHGIGRGAVRRRSRERHRIAVRHAADPCGEEGARRRAQGGHRRGARLPSLRPGRPVALPEVRQPLLRAQGPGPRRRAAVAVPRPRQDVLRAHARPARIVEAARVGVDVLRRVHGRRAPPAGDGRPRRGPPSTRRGSCACGSARSWRCAPRTAGRGPSTSTAPWSWAA